VPDLAASVLALQAGAGNAAVARHLAGARVIQRMTFARFSTLGPLSNWGWYSDEENALLKEETELGTTISGLEAWAAADGQIQGLLAQFVALQQSHVAEAQYKQVSATMKQLERQLKERRAALLNENPNRVANDPQFVNHHPEALTGEIQQLQAPKVCSASAARRRASTRWSARARTCGPRAPSRSS